jgi:hypothetical protein
MDRTMLAKLTGTPKQISYANAIRERWIASQEAFADEARRIGEGDTSLLVIGPHEEAVFTTFARQPARIMLRLTMMLRARTTAKAWIESPEGNFFRLSKRAA